MKSLTIILITAICFGVTFTGTYAQALSPSHNPDYLKQSDLQDPIKIYKNSVSSYQVGTTISLGKYNKKPIKWNILSINSKNEALLFALDVLPNTRLPFDKKSNIWKTSFIRAWLNGTKKGEFLSNKNFTKEESNVIIKKRLSSGILGETTNDFVFLISKEEYKKYKVGDVKKDVNSYWSRTGEANTKKGGYPGNVVLLSSNHQFSGSFSASQDGGIRPMMWVDLKKLEKSSNKKDQTKTISVDIKKTDNLIVAKNGSRYQVYGPFSASKGDTISCRLNNDIKARLEMIISGQGKKVEGVEMSNTVGIGKSFTATIPIDILNKKQQFYVFIGSDDISNLTGTIVLPKH